MKPKKKKPSPPSPELRAEIARFMRMHGLTALKPKFERQAMYDACRYFPVIQVYHGAQPWPELWYGVLFDANQSTGQFISGKTRDELLTKFDSDFLTRREPGPNDPPLLVEVYL